MEGTNHLVLFARRGRIRRRGEFLVVGEDKYPITRVSGIVLSGGAQITTQAVKLALDYGIPITFASGSRILGVVVPFHDRFVELRRRQWEVVLTQRSLRVGLARSIVISSIRARKAVLEFLESVGVVTSVGRAVERMERLEDRAEGADRVGALRGYEGRAARIYFRALSEALPGWAFSGGRTRRPPRDPFNAAISFGYTAVLFPVMLARIVAAGLDPFAGFLHEIRGRKPALALDLMDEWRALAVDVPVLRLFLEGGLSRSDFRRDGEAVLLRDAEAVAIPVLSVLSRVRGGLLEAIDRRLTEFRNAVRKLSEPEPLEIKSDDVGGVWEVVQV